MLIKLTEIKKVQGKLEEGPILINPEGIAAVLEDTDQLVKGDIHIFGSDNNEHRILSLIQMRTGQKLAVKETLDEIQVLANKPKRAIVALLGSEEEDYPPPIPGTPEQVAAKLDLAAAQERGETSIS